MISRSYEMYEYSDDVVPLSSFFDEFKIKPEEVDLFKLTIKVELGRVYYEGEIPSIYVIINYDNS